jgi:hypothetical protein
MKGEWLRRPADGVAVVFVHGVLSSGTASWTNANGAYWPSLLETDPNAKGIGVYVFTYRTDLFSGSYRLGDAVDALKERMRLDGLFACHTVVFVAHSMGGLVVRKLLVERARDFAERNITVGLFLVASPSLGSFYANILEPLARLLGHTQGHALRFSQDNAWLMDLDKEFKNLKEVNTLRLSGKELAEDKFMVAPKFVRRQVVEPFSALRYFGEPYKVPGTDHFSVAAPASVEADQHGLLMLFIAALPAPVRPKLPIEGELRQRLQTLLNACGETHVPFRAYHKLAALFSMNSRFAETCFKSAGPDVPSRLVEWLRGTILAQLTKEQGLLAQAGALDDDPSIAQAAVFARSERSAEVDERHLLLALLANRSSGTMAEIERSLGADKIARVAETANRERPSRVAFGLSGVLPLEVEPPQ